MHNSFNGAQLRLVRFFNNFSLEEVAAQVDCTRQYLHKLETNQGLPSDEMAIRLATALGVLPEFFFNCAVEVNEEQVHFRKQFTTRAVVKHVAIARAELFARLVQYLDRVLALPKVNFPHHEVRGVEDVERAAEICRQYWGLGSGPIDHMMRLAENLGVLITTFPGVSTEVDALSVALQRPIIVRNEAKLSTCRQRFDIGHEVGHFVLHDGRLTGDRQSESEANRFANALLVPRAMMAKAFPRPKGVRLDWAGIREFKMDWKISKAALLYRARQLELISDDQYKSGVITLRRTGEATGEREDNLIPPEQPELLQTSLRVLAERKGIYVADIAKELRVSVGLLRELIGFNPPTAPVRLKPDLRLVA